MKKITFDMTRSEASFLARDLARAVEESIDHETDWTVKMSCHLNGEYVHLELNVKRPSEKGSSNGGL